MPVESIYQMFTRLGAPGFFVKRDSWPPFDSAVESAGREVESCCKRLAARAHKQIVMVDFLLKRRNKIGLVGSVAAQSTCV